MRKLLSVVLFLAAATVIAGGVPKLQSTVPGVQQTGSINVSGTVTAGAFSGSDGGVLAGAPTLIFQTSIDGGMGVNAFLPDAGNKPAIIVENTSALDGGAFADELVSFQAPIGHEFLGIFAFSQSDTGALRLFAPSSQGLGANPIYASLTADSLTMGDGTGFSTSFSGAEDGVTIEQFRPDAGVQFEGACGAATAACIDVIDEASVNRTAGGVWAAQNHNGTNFAVAGPTAVTLGTSTVPVVAELGPNYIGTETGSNNAIAGALVDSLGNNVSLVAGLRVCVLLAHSLAGNGANTFALNGTSKGIKSHYNAANGLTTAYVSGGTFCASYDGTQWQDLAQ